MAKQDVEQDKVRISAAPSPDSALKHLDEVFIVVTQAFCPAGHNLISEENLTFDGYPGIKLNLKTEGKNGTVYLSPFHGDESKKGDLDWDDGTKFEISCPQCNGALPRLANCHCDETGTLSGELLKLYLSPALNDSHILALCNVWGCRRSRTIDNWNIISEFLDGSISD